MIALKTFFAPPTSLAIKSRDQWTIRGLYFFYFGGIGLFFTFLNVYYQSIGLSGTQIGLINTLGPLIGIFSTPIWGMLSDRLGKTRLLFGLTVSGTIISVLALSTAKTFLWIMLVICVSSLFSNTISPLLDGTTMSMLGQHRERYGVFRVWGSIGFILTTATIGFIYERFGLHTMFAAYTLVLILYLATSQRLPDQSIRLSGSIMQGLGEMVRQPLWMLFAASVFLLWLASSGMMAFIGVTIKAMGGSERLIGLSWTTAAIPELPVMFFSALLLRKFGAPRLLAVSFVGYALRMALYGIMPSPNWVLAINTLNCVSFVPFWVSSVAYANDLAPESLKTTTQGLLFSITSLAGVVGAMLSGWLFDQIGPSGLFRILTGFCVLAFLLFATGQFFLNKKGRQ